MKQILVLAYYFPPLGGAGVQRTASFVRHLRAHGYRCVVVTGPSDGGPEWAPADESVSTEVPADTSVLRVPGPVPGAGLRWAARGRRWLARPTPFATWWIEGAAAAAKDALSESALVYASMSPFESAEAARRLARAAGVPWVADLRDPWALDDWTVYPSALHRLVERRRMRSSLADAAAVVMNTPEAAKALRSAAPELAPRTETIPNGWERDDFEGPPPVRSDHAFRIVYAGYSHVAGGVRHERRGALRRLLGGTAPGLDVLARSHVPLERALERLHGGGPEAGPRIELHVAGPAPASVPSGHVVDHGYLPHVEAVELMRSADLLYLAMHGLPDGARTRTVPGKTYEYLAARRPILAALPDGDARDLLTGLPNVFLCRPSDVACLARGVAAATAGELGAGPPEQLLAQYERRALARKLAEVFDRVLAEHARRPGTRFEPGR